MPDDADNGRYGSTEGEHTEYGGVGDPDQS
jgi:hypothetical protein